MQIIENFFIGAIVIGIVLIILYFEDFWWDVVSDVIFYGVDFFIYWYKYDFKTAWQRTLRDWHPFLMRLKDKWHEKHSKKSEHKKE